MWHKDKYPDAMKKLPEEIRNKAITIANARLEEDMDGNRKTLIETSIRLAEAWAKNREKKTGVITKRKTKAKATAKKVAKATTKKKTKKTSRKKSVAEAPHGKDEHLIPSHPKVEPESKVTNKNIQQLFNHQEEISMREEQKKAKQATAAMRGKNRYKVYSNPGPR